MDMVVVIKMGDHTHGTYFLWVPIIQFYSMHMHVHIFKHAILPIDSNVTFFFY